MNEEKNSLADKINLHRVECALKDTQIRQLEKEKKKLEDRVDALSMNIIELKKTNEEMSAVLPKLLRENQQLEVQLELLSNYKASDEPKPQAGQKPRGHSNPRRSRGKFRGGRVTVPYSSDRSTPYLAASTSFYPAQFSGAGFDGVDLGSTSMNQPPNYPGNNFPSYSHNNRNIGGQLYPAQPAIGGPSYISFAPNQFNANQGGYPFQR